MDLEALAEEIESIQTNARKRRMPYCRQIVVDRDGSTVMVGGRDKGRASEKSRCVHNRQDGSHIMHPFLVRSSTNARMICAGLLAFYACQSWPTELWDQKTDERYKNDARSRSQLPPAVLARVIERVNAEYRSTAERLEAFVDAAALESDGLGNAARRADAERAFESALPILRFCAAKYPLSPTGQRQTGGVILAAIDFAADRESGDPRRMRRAAIQDAHRNITDMAKAAAVASVADAADDEVSEDDLLAVIGEITSAPDFTADLFAMA